MAAINKEMDLFNIDEIAKKHGVIFIDGKIKIPYEMDSAVFEILTIYYAQRDNAYKNAKWLTETLIAQVLKAENMDAVIRIVTAFKEILDNKI